MPSYYCKISVARTQEFVGRRAVFLVFFFFVGGGGD